jgi:hypothetical protein
MKNITTPEAAKLQKLVDSGEMGCEKDRDEL